MKLGLTMIVKDEVHCIGETLLSFKPWVDAWFIADTGSTDGTQGAVSSLMDDLPGEMVQIPFHDFSQARNTCLDLAEEAFPDITHWVMADADDVLVNGDSLRCMLAIVPGECFSLQQRWPRETIQVPRVVRACSGWRYTGRVHEVLSKGDQKTTALLGPHLDHYPGPIGTRNSQERWVRDVVWMNEMLIENPEDERTKEHLRKTLRALDELEKTTRG